MKGIIYEIFQQTEPNTVYLGSTLKSEERRMIEHKSNYKRYLNGTYPYISSFEILKYPDAVIKVIATVEVESKQELRKEEDKYILQYRNDANYKVVNVNRAFTTKNEKKDESKEYYIKNLEKYTEQHKKYRELNKDKIHEKFDCLCGGKYTRTGKSQHSKTKQHIQYILNNCNVTINN